jgi:hypothetical protein
VARPDAAERQHLPEPLATGLQPVDEVKGGRPEVARAVRPGQRSRMQQHAGRARESHARVIGHSRSSCPAAASTTTLRAASA